MQLAIGLFASVLLIIGLLLYAGRWVGLWIEAFRQSLLWGLVVFLVPPATIVFAISRWQAAKIPSLTLLIGMVLMVLGYLLVLASGISIPDA